MVALQADAARRLRPSARRRVDSARAALRLAWTAEDYYAGVARVMSDLARAAIGIAYDLEPSGALGRVGHTAGGTGKSWGEVRNPELIAPRLMYRFDNPDEHANEPVRCDRLELLSGGRFDEARERIFRPNGVQYQLRVVLFDGPRFAGFVGGLRTRREGRFSEEDEDALRALIPDLLDSVSAGSCVGRGRMCVGALEATLATFPTPAFLVTSNARVAYANPSARAAYRSAPEWLGLVVGEAHADAVSPFAACTRLELDGRPIFLGGATGQSDGRAGHLAATLARPHRCADR